MNKNTILSLLLKEATSLKFAVAQCEIAKMNGDMQLANNLEFFIIAK